MKKHFQLKNEGTAKISALLGKPQHVVSDAQWMGSAPIGALDAASHALTGGQDNETML